MTRELCILSDLVDTRRVKHHLVQGGVTTVMNPPHFLILEGDNSSTGAMLYRFESNGECVGDTWHSNLNEAKKRASTEYEGLANNWQEIPDDCDMVEFGLSQFKAKLIP
ncbi:MAG: hypothetical protein IT560_15220 [Alphaproteobacteria bacterium]|nr:hypothetical protein [Alphaproteobacteria bacterium]